VGGVLTNGKLAHLLVALALASLTDTSYRTSLSWQRPSLLASCISVCVSEVWYYPEGGQNFREVDEGVPRKSMSRLSLALHAGTN